MENPTIHSFVEALLAEKNLQGVDDDVKAQLIEDLAASLEDQINAALLDQLSDEDLEEFERIVDEESVDNITNYFYNKNINVTEVTAGVLARFRASYLSS